MTPPETPYRSNLRRISEAYKRLHERRQERLAALHPRLEAEDAGKILRFVILLLAIAMVFLLIKFNAPPLPLPEPPGLTPFHY